MHCQQGAGSSLVNDVIAKIDAFLLRALRWGYRPSDDSKRLSDQLYQADKKHVQGNNNKCGAFNTQPVHIVEPFFGQLQF